MARGFKTGGRTKGTPNKKTLDVIERLESLGCDPIQGMAKIAMDDGAPIEVRARMYSELAGYVAPKRKAVEHSGEGSGEISISWMNTTDVRELPTSELVDLILQGIANGEYPAEQVPQLMDTLRAQIATHR